MEPESDLFNALSFLQTQIKLFLCGTSTLFLA